MFSHEGENTFVLTDPTEKSDPKTEFVKFREEGDQVTLWLRCGDEWAYRVNLHRTDDNRYEGGWTATSDKDGSTDFGTISGRIYRDGDHLVIRASWHEGGDKWIWFAILDRIDPDNLN